MYARYKKLKRLKWESRRVLSMSIFAALEVQEGLSYCRLSHTPLQDDTRSSIIVGEGQTWRIGVYTLGLLGFIRVTIK